MPRYINSEKKSSEKKSSEKNRSDLPTLFQIKNKRNKKKEKRKSTYLPCLKFSSNSKHTLLFFWPQAES